MSYSDKQRQDQANWRQVRQVLFNDWDPIGVNHLDGAEDEYDSYVGQILSLLERHASADEVFNRLWWIETDMMGLTGGSKEHTLNVAQRLVKLARELEH